MGSFDKVGPGLSDVQTLARTADFWGSACKKKYMDPRKCFALRTRYKDKEEDMYLATDWLIKALFVCRTSEGVVRVVASLHEVDDE